MLSHVALHGLATELLQLSFEVIEHNIVGEAFENQGHLPVRVDPVVSPVSKRSDGWPSQNLGGARDSIKRLKVGTHVGEMCGMKRKTERSVFSYPFMGPWMTTIGVASASINVKAMERQIATSRIPNRGHRAIRVRTEDP